MEVIESGYSYQLSDGTKLEFARVLETGETIWTGLTNEEVLCVLIDRLMQQNFTLSSDENKNALDALHNALFYLNRRNTLRSKQGVAGTASEHNSGPFRVTVKRIEGDEADNELLPAPLERRSMDRIKADLAKLSDS